MQKSHNHSHFWIDDKVLYETYKTIQGLRFRKVCELNFRIKNIEILSESDIKFISEKLNKTI